MDQRFCLRVRYPAYLAVICLLALCGCHTKPSPVQTVSGGAVRPLPQAGELDDGEWHRATKDFSNHRYSQLDQINASNVLQLRVAFSFSAGVAHCQEAAPVIAIRPCIWRRHGRMSCMPLISRNRALRSSGSMSLIRRGQSHLEM